MQQSIIQHGFLPEDWFRELDESWPEPPEEKGFRGQRDLSSRDPRFEELPHCWQRLHLLFHTQSFWLAALAMLQIPKANVALFKREAHEGGTFEIEDARKIPNIQYGRMDLGWGGVGYGKEGGGRGPHIDNWPRVISGLLYFSDQREMDGGQFQLLGRNRTIHEDSVVHEVPLCRNMAIMTVQNRDGLHQVKPVERFHGDTQWRRAVYFALSDTRDIFGRSGGQAP